MNYKFLSLFSIFLVTEYLQNSNMISEESAKFFVMITYGNFVQFVIDITNGVYI